MPTADGDMSRVWIASHTAWAILAWRASVAAGSGIEGIWRPITSTTSSEEISPFHPGAVTGPVASSM